MIRPSFIFLACALALVSCRAEKVPSPGASRAVRALSQSLGPADAPVQVVEVGDFACPACRALEGRFVTPVLRRLASEGKIRFTFQDFPLAAIHPRALAASAAAACVANQGKFWDYHDALYDTQESWEHLDSASAIATFSRTAALVGADTTALAACLSQGGTWAQADSAWARGVAAGFRATPTFIVNGEALPPGSGNAVMQALAQHHVDLREFETPAATKP